MEKRLKDVLEGRAENHILPFFWQHGEEEELLLEGMERIHESGIGAVCVESRPHPDFLGKRWWRDLDLIIAKAKELGMRVWVLDDAHFPSGFCNGKITSDSPYGKTYLTHYCIDAVGPLKGCGFMVRMEPGEELIGVTLGRRDREESFCLTEIQDISAKVKGGRVKVDLPEGTWCIHVIKTTRKGTGRKGYINTIDRQAVRFFIDTVYEAHYAHYKEEFGKTFAGFFSDEPEIGNCLGEYLHDAHIGQPDMNLPWSEEVKKRILAMWGNQFVCHLTALWMNVDKNREEKNRTGYLRMQFMDLISELYGTNFCMQIGEWCREHSVEYIGHVIEDGGSHARLGMGTGHFFRALWGQDMAGIDVVLQQIRPQLDDFPFYSIGGKGFYHGELFHYGLAKMGVSLGHLDRKKKGRTMCEVFGAYGWSEGLKLMKWLLDHMLVCGVNYFVPHAFTMKEFPDPDCPPHFYARGMNPQFPYFRYLMEYCNRVSHLLEGGRHVPCAALLYTAEQEWTGAYRPFEKDARVLTRNQIDFEVLPMDYLLSVTPKDGVLRWGEEQVRVLIVPGSRFILRKLADWLDQAMKTGLMIIFTEQIPFVLEEDGSLSKRWQLQEQQPSLPGQNPLLCKEDNLADMIRRGGLHEIKTQSEEPWLRYYHYEQENGGLWLFFTESITKKIDTWIRFNEKKFEDVCWYDPWTNQLLPCERRLGEENEIRLQLSSYEMRILYTGKLSKEKMIKIEEIKRSYQKKKTIRKLSEDNSVWSLAVKEAGSRKTISQPFSPVLGDISSDDRLPLFSGTMYYDTSFDARSEQKCVLDLGEVYETAKVTVNGKNAGVRIAPPYRFELTGYLKNGQNKLEIEIANTLVNRQRDFMSMTMPLEPSGLIGPVMLETEEE